MAFNDLRCPKVSVLANGVLIDGVVSLEVCNNSFMEADRYRISIALDSTGPNFWASNAIDLDISVGLDGAWQRLIVGPVDRVEIVLGENMVYVDGRDLTARFIEARSQETFENQTASEIVTLIAARRGLEANVATTSALIGRDFGGGHSQITLDQYASATTEWDLLARLADVEGFDVWVDGTTLNFSVPQLDPSPVVFTPQDCSCVRLDRTLALCGPLQVSVKSWDSRGQQAFSQQANSGGTTGLTRSYVLVRPNLTATAAAALASRTLSQMTQNARVITLETAGDLVARPRQSLALANTGTAFDGSYVITSVERRISVARGFTETLQARTAPWTTSSTI